MGCIFFEGFNYSNSDYTTLDPTYWSGVSADASIYKPDYGMYTFIKGRTNNSHIIPSRSSETGVLNSASLMLSGFPDDLACSVYISFSLEMTSSETESLSIAIGLVAAICMARL